MSWVLIGGFSIAVAFILVQLFKFFVTAPELAAQEEQTKRKNANKKPTGQKSNKSQKSSDSSHKSHQQQESSSSSSHESSSSQKKQPAAQPQPTQPAAVNSPSPVTKDETSKPAKPSKGAKDPKVSKLSSSNEKATSSGSESAPEKPAEKQQEKQEKKATNNNNKGKGKAPGEKKDKKDKKEKKEKKEVVPETVYDPETDVTDAALANNWGDDFIPAASSATSKSTASKGVWKTTGGDAAAAEKEKALREEVNNWMTKHNDLLREKSSAYETHLAALSKANTAYKTLEQTHQQTVARLQRELEAAREGGMSTNDSIRSKDYSKTEKPKAVASGPSFTSLLEQEQKQKEKGKEKEKEEKGKEKEDRDRHEKERAEREKSDKERHEQDKQEREKLSATFKQRIADLEAKQRELTEQLKATEAVNGFLTSSLVAESKKAPVAAEPVEAKPDPALNKKIEELTQQLSKKEKEISTLSAQVKSAEEAQEKVKSLTAQLKAAEEAQEKVKSLSAQLKTAEEAQEKVKALTAQLSEKEAEAKVAEEAHTQALSEAHAQSDKLRAQLTALEASSAKGSGNEEAIKQLQQQVQDEKEKTDSAQQQADLAEAAKVSYKGKFEDAQKATAELQSKLDALKKSHEQLEQQTKTHEADLAAAKSASSSNAEVQKQLEEAQQQLAEVKKKYASQEMALTISKKALDDAKTKAHQLESEKAAWNTAQSTEGKLVEEAKVQVADAVKNAEEANTRADEATKRVNEAAKNIQDLTDELTNLKKKHEEGADDHKEEVRVLQANLSAEIESRMSVVSRLEALSARVKELESQPQAGGAAGLKLLINSPNRIPTDTPADQQ